MSRLMVRRETSNFSARYQLMEKLSAGASNLLAGDTHILIDLSSWYKSSLSPKIELLHSAVLTRRKVSFTYFAGNLEFFCKLWGSYFLLL